MNKDLITLKQHYESGGLNSIDIRLEAEGKEVFLTVIKTDFNPFNENIQRYFLNKIDNYSDNDFLYYLKKVLTSELPY